MCSSVAALQAKWIPTHLVLGELGEGPAHVLLQPVQCHRGLVGQHVHALCELVCDCNKSNNRHGKRRAWDVPKKSQPGTSLLPWSPTGSGCSAFRVMPITDQFGGGKELSRAQALLLCLAGNAASPSLSCSGFSLLRASSGMLLSKVMSYKSPWRRLAGCQPGKLCCCSEVAAEPLPLLTPLSSWPRLCPGPTPPSNTFPIESQL